MAESYSIAWTYHILHMHSSADEQLDGFLFGIIMNATAKNIHM